MNEIKKYLFSKRNLGIKLGLDRTLALLGACGNPHNNITCIQIAGTNGKGSTAAFLSNIFLKAGYITGLSTSPHLVNINERLRINGIPIESSFIVEFVERFRKQIDLIGTSFFEIITVLGFYYFNKNKIDIAILETGLGGRLDSVSVCNPIQTLITSISLDHTEILGGTVEIIAREKAGIMKKNIPCFSVPQLPHVESTLKFEASRIGTNIEWVRKPVSNEFDVGLPGVHQEINAALAAESASQALGFHINRVHIIDGLQDTKWFGRGQILSDRPFVLFDVCHNSDSINAFLKTFKKKSISGENFLILALEKRKDISKEVLTLVRVFDKIILTTTESAGGASTRELRRLFATSKKTDDFNDPLEAISITMERVKKNDAVAIIGTHHLGPAVGSYFKKSFDIL